MNDHTTCIDKNINKIMLYNWHYDLFITDDNKLYRMNDGIFVRFRFQYDFWRDVGKPKYVTNIVNTLIELFLFPLDVCNIVYCKLINTYHTGYFM